MGNHEKHQQGADQSHIFHEINRLGHLFHRLLDSPEIMHGETHGYQENQKQDYAYKWKYAEQDTCPAEK